MKEVKQVTTVSQDILVCLMEDGSLYSTKLKGRGKGRWVGISVPNTVTWEKYPNFDSKSQPPTDKKSALPNQDQDS